MGLSDWTDLDLLARKIAESQDRLEGARATQNHGLVRLLEKEMAAAEILRDRMLSDIAAYLTSSAVSAEQCYRIPSGINAEPPAPIAIEKRSEGVETMWNQLSCADLQPYDRSSIGVAPRCSPGMPKS